MTFIVHHLSLYHGSCLADPNLPSLPLDLTRAITDMKRIRESSITFMSFHVQHIKVISHLRGKIPNAMYSKLIFCIVCEFLWIAHGSHQTFLCSSLSPWIHFFEENFPFRVLVGVYVSKWYTVLMRLVLLFGDDDAIMIWSVYT